MTGVVFSIHGVHGAGKTFISKPVAEDLGIEFVQVDSADRFKDIGRLNFLMRERVYAYDSLSGYAYALGKAEHGSSVFVDFGPRQIIPYVEWFMGGSEGAKKLINYVEASLEALEASTTAKVVNVFFVVEKDYDVVLERIKRRARLHLLREELDRRYLEFIDAKMKEMMDSLEENGSDIVEVPADGNIAEKIRVLWEGVRKHLDF